MLTTAELEEATRAVEYPNPTDCTARAQARTEYRATIKGLENQWQEWLADEYASDLPSSIQNAIYVRAWAEGHSSGYHSVEDQYMEFSDFAREVAQAVKG